MTVFLDTHALLWMVYAPRQLSPKARRTIETADEVGIPSIVFWEVALLARKRKIDLGMSAAEWAQAIQKLPRVKAVPLSASAAILADSLEMHSDPADRFIVAAALEAQAPLVTKDRLIRQAKVVQTIW